MQTPKKRTISCLSSNGAVIVEFAVSIPFLIALFALVTDFSLAILTKTQVQNAARAGAEFAAAYGYDALGIKNAATVAVNRGAITIVAANVSSTVACGCTSTGAIVNNADTAPACSVTKCSDGTWPTPFATVTVTGSYTPIIRSFWNWSTTQSFSATVVGRTNIPPT